MPGSGPARGDVTALASPDSSGPTDSTGQLGPTRRLVSTRDESALDTKLCPDCAEEIKTAAVVCRFCSYRVDELARADQITPSGGRTAIRPTPSRRYRGPRRVLTSGAIALIVGFPAALASFSTVQGQGASGFLLSTASPAINLGFRTVGLGQIKAPEGGAGASAMLVGTFIVGAILTALGMFLLVSGAIWMTARYSPRKRGADLYRHASPAASHVVHQGARQMNAAVSRSHEEVIKARPKLTRAAHNGHQMITDDVLPQVAAGTKRGLEQWHKVSPRLGAVATRGRRWVTSTTRRWGSSRQAPGPLRSTVAESANPAPQLAATDAARSKISSPDQQD